MDIGVIFGALILLAWAGFLFWILGATAVWAIREPSGRAASCAAGLLGGCLLGVGVVLAVKNSLPSDTIGLGYVLAIVGTLWIWPD
jgi:hypothetical protein